MRGDCGDWGRRWRQGVLAAWLGLGGAVAWAANPAPTTAAPAPAPDSAAASTAGTAGTAGVAGAVGAASAPGVAAPQPASLGGIQSANILELRDASSEPDYAGQSNAQRMKVQPGNNAPVWRQVGQGVTGTTKYPYPEVGTLIQPTVQYPLVRATNAGEAWREVRNRWILPYGGALLLIVALALAIFYFGKGPLGHPSRPGGRRIERFTPLERAAHWTNATAFVVLAVSGIVMAFGRFFLLPVMGTALFGWLAYVLKTLHNFVGPLFAVSLVIVILTFVKDNIASRADLAWLLKAGGMFGDHEVPSHRFNAGEKGIFWWGVTVPGLVVVASGLVLDKLIPGWTALRADMHIANMVHASAAIWMMAVLAGHIYMGTVGMHGAFKAMKTGYVDEDWAREHHELWYDDIRAGKIPAQRSAVVPPEATAGSPPLTQGKA